MLRKIILPVLMFSCLAGVAQNQANIWYFGNHAGLDFNGGAPVPLTDGQLNTNEGVASIADNGGNLLFYTDGKTIYNLNHEIMENGDNLMGDYSSSQSAVIVPKPLSATIYYIFTVTLEGNPDGFRYSEVDMALDGGLGAVTENKNIPLLAQCTEQVTAVKHANGSDIWVITHGFGNNAFHAYLVTSAGVNEVAVVSNSGVSFAATVEATVGCMKVSPQGTRLGICNYPSGAHLFDFDAATGQVSNHLQLTALQRMYGIEFSPSGDVLYITNELAADVTQFDLTAANIPASATVVLTDNPGTGGALQLAPDGKIYKGTNGSEFLSVIHNPDIAGAGCEAESGSLHLGGALSMHGLPCFIQSYFAFGIRAEHLCFGDTTQFSIISDVAPDAVSWDFGDGSSSEDTEPGHIYEAPGMYAVSATVTLNGSNEVIVKNITINPIPVAHTPPEQYECDNENGTGQVQFSLSKDEAVTLGGQSPLEYTVTYHTSEENAQNDTAALPDNYTNAADPETIFVRVENNSTGCFAITSFSINIIKKPVIEMPDKYSFCEGGSVTITAPPGFDSYLWSTGAVTPSIIVDEAGTYTLTVTQDHGDTQCEASTEVVVGVSEAPVIVNVVVEDWTDSTNSITIEASGTDNEYSIDGVNYQDGPVFTGLEPGFYRVYVRSLHDCGSDEEEVALLMYPRYFTPNGDSDNETWHIRYSRYEPALLVHIFDRYGKLVTSLKSGGPGWDGTLNGERLVATDYWFVAVREDGTRHKGHFSLIR